MKKLILLLAFVLNGCLPTDAQYSLPNGYRLAETSSIQMLISDSRSRGLFYGNITRINFEGNIVFGIMDPLPSNYQHLIDKRYEHLGYFILDTESGTFQLGLDKQSWLNVLKQEGISEEPTLISPPILGINKFLFR